MILVIVCCVNCLFDFFLLWFFLFVGWYIELYGLYVLFVVGGIFYRFREYFLSTDLNLEYTSRNEV